MRGTDGHRWTPRILSGGRVAVVIAVGLVASFFASPVLAAQTAGPIPVNGAVPSASVEFLNLTATSSLSFVPDQLVVTAGASVHLRILQAANFEHTFTLSSVANDTIPTSDTSAQLTAYFTSHPPLVNLSLGDVPLTYHYANFTAPPVGSYEFVCLVPTHFEGGMHGTLVSSSASVPGSSAPSNGLSPWSIAGISLIVVAILALLVAFVLLRRRRARSGSAP